VQIQVSQVRRPESAAIVLIVRYGEAARIGGLGADTDIVKIIVRQQVAGVTGVAPEA
jgi:hypothetical protein